MKLKIVLVLMLVLSLLIVNFSGCVEEKAVTPTQPIAPRVEAATATPAPIPKSTTTSNATPTPTLIETQEVSQPEQIKFSGTGSGITPIFQLESGTSLFKMKNGAPYNFTVLLIDTEAIEFCGCCYKYVSAVPIDTTGPFDGAKIVEILDTGDYILDVEAEGPWSVIIEKP